LFIAALLGSLIFLAYLDELILWIIS
jgi:hypothetical protein